jgi:hypothetical protein
MNGEPCSKMVAQVSLKNNQDAHPPQRKIIILDNQWVTINEVAHHLCVSQGSAHEII